MNKNINIKSFLFPIFWLGLIITTYMSVSAIYILISFILTLFYIIYKKKYKINNIKISWWIIFVSYYFLISCIGLINRNLDFKMLVEFGIKYVIIPVIIICLIPKKEEHFKKTIAILKGVIIFTAVYGLIESIFKFNPLANIIMISPKNWIFAMNDSDNYQCSSIFLHYNYYGVVLLIGWALDSVFPFKYKKIDIVYKLLIIEQILVCQSRICWIAFLILILIDLIKLIKEKKLSNKNKKALLIMAVIAIIIIVINPFFINKLGDFISSRFSNLFKYGFKDGSLGQRLGTLMNWPEYFKVNIVQGIFGTGYKSIMTNYMNQYSYFPGYSTADCMWTIFLVEVGIVGTILSIIWTVRMIVFKGEICHNELKNKAIIILIIIANTLDIVANNIILVLLYFLIIQVTISENIEKNDSSKKIVDRMEQNIVEDDIYKIIEDLYLEIKTLKQNKGYKLYKKINRLKNDIRHCKFKDILKRICLNIKLIFFKKDLKISSKNEKKYSKYLGDKKIAVYTCITGKYDNICEPIIKENKCKYYLYTNNSNLTSKNFEIKSIPDEITKKFNDNILINRYIKMHPYELFEGEFDYAIYIDGNIRIISDISSFVNYVSSDYGIAMHKHSIRDCIYKEEKALRLLKKGNKKKIRQQLKNYQDNGFPEKYGMLEANVIVTDLKNKKGKEIFNNWWEEFINSNSLRDQLALPYVLWKNKIKTEEIATLGNNVYDNYKLEIVSHN